MPGELVQFKIDTPSSNYRLDIYRMGYYSGRGARRVTAPAGILPSAALPQVQPPCLTDASGLIDCGNWGVSASWAVPIDAVSGIYFAKLNRIDTGGASHIFFIVREADGASHKSDLLFQTSDTTWQAYNNYGGNSLYEGGPGTNPGRAYKVSYNRPFATRAVAGGQDWVFNAEYPMVRFLEANGFDVSYTTGVDSDRNGALIQDHKVFLSVGHDEYWSGHAARERRGRSRGRRQPVVLQRQRDLLEDAVGELDRRIGDGRTARSSRTRKRTRTRRSIRPAPPCGPAPGAIRGSARPATPGPKTR